MTTCPTHRARIVIIGGGVVGTSVGLSPGPARRDRRAAARAGRAVVAARRGTRPGWSASCAPTQSRHDASCSTAPRSTSSSRTRSAWAPASSAAAASPSPAPRTAWSSCGARPRRAAAYDLECELLTPEQAGERYPLLRTDDLLGAHLAARRRHGQPDRPDPGAGARAPGSAARPCVEHVRVTEVAGRRRARSPACAPTRATSRPRSSSTAPASGRTQLGALDRRRGAAALRRALLRRDGPDRRAYAPTCRSCATPTATPTSRRRSAASSSAASSPRPSRGSRPTRSRTRSSSSCSTRTGSTSRS